MSRAVAVRASRACVRSTEAYGRHVLADFLHTHREEVLSRARLYLADRNDPASSELELTHGLPIFLTQLGKALTRAADAEPPDHRELQATAEKHGLELFDEGLSVAQVVHDYGGLCQVITTLAMEKKLSLGAEEFQTLNLCLDDAIAGAVTAYAKHREGTVREEGSERLGVLTREMRALLESALLSFTSIKKGIVTASGSTGSLHERSLTALMRLVDRSLADVRLDAGISNLERVLVWKIVDEVQIGSLLAAESRGLRLVVGAVDRELAVRVDRQVLTASVANLLQNAIAFTKPGSTIRLSVAAPAEHVLIDVEDECGGLPEGAAAELLAPYQQQGAERSERGLDLSICVKAADAMGGALTVRDRPGRGCVFTLALPKVSRTPSAVPARFAPSDDDPTPNAN